ncbi:MAG: hypothetical protein JW839_18270 [Candidatus Lokiarchaeota archaeon]|nr:hypothetical protein [Candidatus Lokiarchaeota archaeon]
MDDQTDRSHWRRTQFTEWAGVLWKFEKAGQRVAEKKLTEEELKFYEELSFEVAPFYVPDYASLFRRGECTDVEDERITTGDWIALDDATEKISDEEWRRFPIIPWKDVPVIVWEGLAIHAEEFNWDVSIEILVNRISRDDYSRYFGGYPIDEDLFYMIEDVQDDFLLSPMAVSAFTRIARSLEERGLLRETCQVLAFIVQRSASKRIPGFGDPAPHWKRVEDLLAKIGDLAFSKHVWRDLEAGLYGFNQSLAKEARRRADEIHKRLAGGA